MQDDEIFSLIARCALRDQAALKDLYQQMAPYLNRIAFNILKSEDLSNDVLQEAFVQIWQNAISYRAEKGHPKAWMTSIVRYRALDRLAKEKRHSDQIASRAGDNDPLENIESDHRPDDDVQKLQDAHTLTHCLDQLNEETRNSIKLAYLGGYSRDEIAFKFKANVNTVKSWLRRGAEHLKRCIESQTEGQA